MSAFKQFLAENKLWWIVPIVIVLGLVAWMVFADQTDGAGDDASPFIYDSY